MGVWMGEGKRGFPYIQLVVSYYSRRKTPDCSYLSLFVGVRIGGRSERGGYPAATNIDMTRLTKQESKSAMQKVSAMSREDLI